MRFMCQSSCQTLVHTCNKTWFTLLVRLTLAPCFISFLTIPTFPFLAAIMRAVSWEFWNQINSRNTILSTDNVYYTLQVDKKCQGPHSQVRGIVCSLREASTIVELRIWGSRNQWGLKCDSDRHQVKVLSWCIQWNRPHPLIMKIVRSCVVHDWCIEGLGHVTMTTVCGMWGSPLAGLGQHLPPAVAQQYPHVPPVLQCGGQSPLSECIVVCACIRACIRAWMCVYVWRMCMHVCVCVSVHVCMDMCRGGSEWTNKLVLTSLGICPPL